MRLGFFDDYQLRNPDKNIRSNLEGGADRGRPDQAKLARAVCLQAVVSSTCESSFTLYPVKRNFKEKTMKITEDWLSVIIGFAVIIIAMLNVINPDIFAF
jgi:hypothetical protein